MTNLSTPKQLKKTFEELATKHKFLQGNCHWGDANKIGDGQKADYPLLNVHLTNAIMVQSETDSTFKMMEYTFNIKCLDLVEKDEINHPDVESDTLQILTEIVNKLTYAYNGSKIKIQGDIRFDEEVEINDDQASGWGGELIVRSPINNANCFLPFEE